MTVPSAEDVRQTILETVERMARADKQGSSLQADSVLRPIADAIPRHELVPDVERMILDEWSELFRAGYLAWGFNIGNSTPPWFHVTHRGARTFHNLSRDPANPLGYKQYLAGITKLNPIAEAYLSEALECFSAGHHRAAAVMLGAASESLILELRDAAVAGLQKLSQPIPKSLTDWRIKVVLDALRTVIDANNGNLAKSLREEYGAHWNAYAYQIRTTRNDVGHPTSIEPVTEDAAHSLFLMFPTLARLSRQLSDFTANGFK